MLVCLFLDALRLVAGALAAGILDVYIESDKQASRHTVRISLKYNKMKVISAADNCQEVAAMSLHR